MRHKPLFLSIVSITAILLCIFVFVNNTKITGFSFTLPDTIKKQDSGIKTISFVENDSIIGGVIQFNSPSPLCMVDPVEFSGELFSILENNNVKPANNLAYDYFMSGVTAVTDYTITQIWFGNKSEEYIHYLFLTETVCYDLWFDRKQITAEVEAQIKNSVSISP